MVRSARWLGLSLFLFAMGVDAQVDHLRAGVRVGAFDMTNAGDSYDAVYGDPMLVGGLELAAVFDRNWFLQLTVSGGEMEGEQVVLLPEPLPTGYDTTFRMTPVHLTGGRSFGSGRWRFATGLGPSYVSWEEEGEFETTSDENVGGHLLLGLSRTYADWLIGGELVYSIVPDAIGKGGASGQLGEEDMGGVALMFRASRAF